MNTIIRNRFGERIAYSFTPGAEQDSNLVLMGHGVTSDKDRPWSEALAQGLAQRGIASLRIAFSGNGESEGVFTDSTISKEVLDLRAVTDAFPDRRIGYVGHSMGGAVGARAVASDDRLRYFVSLAGMVHTQDFVAQIFGKLKTGELMLDKPGRVLGEAFLQDMREIDSVQSDALDIDVPWLIVHGSADDVVPLHHATDMHQAAAGRSELVVLPDVDHSFTGAGMQAMTVVVLPWLEAVCRAT
ncbi:MAG: pimeloyl-ACP methyl ester carboxylesterase [Planctomycetota bacterium]|jgi:pimeloyl-ACP methyl ester carboxylesterase